MSNIHIVLLVFIILLLVLLTFVIYSLSKKQKQQESSLDQDVFEKEFDKIKKSLHEMNAANKENANRSERELRIIIKVMTNKKTRGYYSQRILSLEERYE